MLSLEFDIDNPQESEIFANYPRILADNHLVEFITDYLRLMVSGNMNAFEIEALMDEEIETFEQESEVPAGSGDGRRLSAGIWYCRGGNGVVHALASADRPAAELGALIANAMVGTFLGILLAYGFISPLSTLLRQKRRDRQDDAVHQGDVALQPQRLRAANRRRIWPQNVIHHRAPVVCRA